MFVAQKNIIAGSTRLKLTGNSQFIGFNCIKQNEFAQHIQHFLNILHNGECTLDVRYYQIFRKFI